MVWIKICGITNEDDAIKVSNLGVNALGFILSTESVRKINPVRAKEIILALKDRFKGDLNKKLPSFAGVFVNEDINKVLKIIEDLCLDYIQLSGDETIAYLEEIKKHNKNIKLIKLIRIKDDISSTETIFNKIQYFKKFVDFFLLDTFKKNIYGGTGKTFNWELVKNWGLEFPVILAGGLDCENVAEAIQIVKPFGVDASTRLEKSPGKKDISKVFKFIKNTKGVGGC